jgi:hypothetical protein
MSPTKDYVKTYKAAKKQLSNLFVSYSETEKQIVLVRKFIQTLAELCESQGIQIDPSPEASYLLKHSTLADEIRAIMKSVSPHFVRPNLIKCDLERLGHDLNKYRNPQSTIQMVLKRMIESGEVQEGTAPENGKKAYRILTYNCDDLINSSMDKLKDDHCVDK